MAVEVIRVGLGRETCCCGLCSVRTGSIIISAIWIIMATYNSISCGSQLIILTNDEKYDPDELANFRVRSEGDYRHVIKAFYASYRMWATALTTTTLLLIGELINIPLSVFCLHGAVKGGPSIKLRAWIWFNTFCVTLSGLFNIAVGAYVTTQFGGVRGIGLVLLFLVVYGGYFWLIGVVYDYAKEIHKFEEGEAHRGPVALSFDGIEIDAGRGQMITGKMKHDKNGDAHAVDGEELQRVIQIY